MIALAAPSTTPVPSVYPSILEPTSTQSSSPTLAPTVQVVSPAHTTISDNSQLGSQRSMGAIVGGTIGSLAFLLVLLALIFWSFRRHFQAQNAVDLEKSIRPFDSQ